MPIILSDNVAIEEACWVMMTSIDFLLEKKKSSV
jgi:hypothetical protein